MSWLEKLGARWGVTNKWQVFVILLVFACTGMTSLYVKGALYWVVGIGEHSPAWWKITYRILATFIAYQFLLLAYAWLFGQFQFFWNFEKRMLSRFVRKKSEDKG